MVEDLNDGFLGAAAATRDDRRQALLVTVVLVAVFVVTAPLAPQHVGSVPQFAAIYDTAIAVIDTLTAVLLYAQFQHVHRRSLLVLACAYVFTPLLVAAHALSLPNAYVPGTVIGGPQSAAWLWVVWHAALPLFATAYARLAHREPAQACLPDGARCSRARVVITSSVALALVTIAVVTAGDSLMPPLMNGDTQQSRVTTLVLAATWLVHIAGLAAVIWYTRLRRVIDTWLAVTLVALTIDVLLSAVLVQSRYQLGYYLGRIYGLLGAIVVLGVLLRETVMLAANARRARIEAERAMALRDEFLAVVSHELRTPLSAVLLWTKLLQRGRIAGYEQSEALDMILHSAEAQQQMIEDLLEASRIISGKLQIAVREVELAPIVEAAVAALRPMASAERVELHVLLDDRIESLQVDPVRIQQIIWNLVNNAVKFTGRLGGGRVNVGLRHLEDAVEIEVTDTGAGISAAFLPHVFDRFRQQDTGVARSTGGLGLGLAITRHLVELHGGTICAHSAGEGRGATFIVSLPYTKEPLQPSWARAPDVSIENERVALSRVLAGARVLVVDDEAAMRAAIRLLLEQCSAKVTAVASAGEALTAFRDALAAGTPFEALVSDLGMPGKSGFDLIRELRLVERERGAAPAIAAVALSAYARDDDRAKATDAGFDAHVSKPVEPATLVNAISELVGAQPV